jgi:hypothetical protein
MCATQVVLTQLNKSNKTGCDPSESNTDREAAEANPDEPGKNLDRDDRQCCEARD